MSDQVLDKWQIALKQKRVEVEECQQNQGLSSCLKCVQLLNCELRDNYIKIVYDSMSKGESGGFEF